MFKASKEADTDSTRSNSRALPGRARVRQRAWRYLLQRDQVPTHRAPSDENPFGCWAAHTTRHEHCPASAAASSAGASAAPAATPAAAAPPAAAPPVVATPCLAPLSADTVASTGTGTGRSKADWRLPSSASPSFRRSERRAANRAIDKAEAQTLCARRGEDAALRIAAAAFFFSFSIVIAFIY